MKQFGVSSAEEAVVIAEENAKALREEAHDMFAAPDVQKAGDAAAVAVGR
jgi:hypothetical protein